MSDLTPPSPPANPYAPPQSQVGVEDLGPPVNQVYEGIGRIGFVLAYVLILFVSASLGAVTNIAGPTLLITALLMLLPVSSRLKNIGRSPAWCVLLLVPVVNLFVIVPCLLLPPGYQDHRRLDTAAKVIAGLLAAVLAACLVMAVMSLRTM